MKANKPSFRLFSYTLLAAFVVLCHIPAASAGVIWQDNFEGAAPNIGGGTRAAGPGHASPADGTQCDPGDYFVRTDEPGIDLTLGYQVEFTNVQDDFYWRAEDLDGNPAPCDGSPHTIDWTGISISGQTDLTFSGFFVAEATFLGTLYEGNDSSLLEYSIDGAPFAKVIEFLPDVASSGNVLSQDVAGACAPRTPRRCLGWR